MSRRSTHSTSTRYCPWNRARRFPSTWNGQDLTGRKGEALSSALIAAGIAVFGRNAHDHSPQGIFCANGQCSKCLVIADGRPVKSCMTPLAAGMEVTAADDLPELPASRTRPRRCWPLPEISTDVLIIGAGPAGLSAAVELGRLGIATLLVDDKSEAGGKLVLQTHKFFGSVEDSQAGTRGIRIGRKLAEAVAADPHVTVWPDSTVLYVYSDRKVGILRGRFLRAGHAQGHSERRRRPGEVAGLSRQPPDRRLWRRRLPDPGQPRPGAAFQPAVHRRRRQRRADRRLPRPAGRHHRGRAWPRRCPPAAATRSTPTS